jgi:hypothetical protein
VDNVDLEKGEVVFRQSVSALYPKFFAPVIAQVKEKRPGLTRISKTSTDNWLSIASGRAGLSYSWVLGREGAGQGALRVELAIDVGDKARNKEIFDSLKKHEKEIASDLGLPLVWERLDPHRASRFSTQIPFRLAIATPEQIEEAQCWAVDTMLKFVDAVTPYLKDV